MGREDEALTLAAGPAEALPPVPALLAPFERGLAAYVASTLGGASRRAAGVRSELVEHNAPEWLLDNVRVGAGLWGVADDDRIDVIVACAARWTRAPGESRTADISILQAIGLNDVAILDLHSVVTRYRDGDNSGERSSPNSARSSRDARDSR